MYNKMYQIEKKMKKQPNNLNKKTFRDYMLLKIHLFICKTLLYKELIKRESRLFEKQDQNGCCAWVQSVIVYIDHTGHRNQSFFRTIGSFFVSKVKKTTVLY